MAKPIRIIGDLDNQRSDKWSCTVLEVEKMQEFVSKWGIAWKKTTTFWLGLS
jgi:hypothetical protein